MATKVLTKLLNYNTDVLDNNAGNLTIKATGVTNGMLAGSINASKLLLTSALENDTGNLDIANSGVTNAMLAGAIEADKLNLKAGVLESAAGDLTISGGGVTNAMLAGSINANNLLLKAGVLQDNAGDLDIASSGVSTAMLAGSIADGKLASSYIYANGTRIMAGNLDMDNSYKVVNVAAPTSNGDATNKLYVDNLAQGIIWKAAVLSKDFLASTGKTHSQVDYDIYDYAQLALPYWSFNFDNGAGGTLVVGDKLVGPASAWTGYISAISGAALVVHKITGATPSDNDSFTSKTYASGWVDNGPTGDVDGSPSVVQTSITLYNGTTSYQLVQGTNFTAGTDNETTANSLATAINGLGSSNVFITKVWSIDGGAHWSVSIAAKTAGATPNGVWTAKLDQNQIDYSIAGMNLRNYNPSNGMWENYLTTEVQYFQLGTDAAITNETHFTQDTDIIWTWNDSEGAWLQISGGGGALVEGDGISITGNVIAVNLSDTNSFSATAASKALLIEGDGKISGDVIDDSDIDHSLVTGVTSEAHLQSTYQEITLVADDITAKYFDLTDIQVSDNFVTVVYGGVQQTVGVDYTIINNGSSQHKRLNWNALGLDGVVAATEKLEVWGMKAGADVNA